MTVTRRNLLRKTLYGSAGMLAGSMLPKAALADRFSPGAAPIHYPDPNIIGLDPRFKYKIGNAAVERIYTGMRWAEGPAWNAVGRYLIWSDIPRNEQLRYTIEDDHVSRNFRMPSGNSNGNTFDFQGRQISCLHQSRQVIRYEHDGSVTVLADSYDGKSFNAPNDVVVNPNDDSIWFTDPGYGSLGWYEGTLADTGSPQPYQKEAVYRIDAQTGKVVKVTDDVYKPNGLCFSPDYKKLYVSDTGASHYSAAKSVIRVWNVTGKVLSGGRDFCSMTYNGKTGNADGIRADIHGNIWAAAGWVGEGYDGVHTFAPNGDRIGVIQIPEICSNLCFGGKHRDRLFITASQSIYSVYVGTQGAHIT
ncbi:SMP-30/gluconolactonase/LRE family protein [Vibrio mangrovi]|uniref:Gluconolactonase n=1 Tax=Vibrio mangrovi TaxID=474394 RepID=A0A1Y6IMC1_9VIBR|nr:SMP-30/gluconolactonase/LRE family protein [Vibrio mangrovi]MDW6004404.1 SMP-30/gluconolactonase/LRE family protein [Vibrio mangrovi]SMR98796.1 Gluconolactonase precursor [Vibrio mangrovi]